VTHDPHLRNRFTVSSHDAFTEFDFQDVETRLIVQLMNQRTMEEEGRGPTGCTQESGDDDDKGGGWGGATGGRGDTVESFGLTSPN
jgi:hypothetical protein